MPVKVAIVDSGIGAQMDASVAARIALQMAHDGQPQAAADAAIDPLGHGTAVASLVLARAPRCALLSAQVFHAGRPCSVRVIAAAIDWCVAEGARVINLSLGLREDRRLLRDSCRAAMEQGVLLVAAHPARGGVAYPAVYPGVVAVQGDARCGEADCSSMEQRFLFGAAASAPAGFSGGGASYAAARVAGLAGAFFETFPGATAADFTNHLPSVARFHGRERRVAVA